MVRPLAFDKLCQLIGMASPTSRLITNDNNTRELVAKGMVIEDEKGFTISPGGLRLLAEQMEAGHVARAIDRMKREYEERLKRAKK